MHFIKKIQSYSMFIRPFAFIGTAIIFVCSSLIAINTPPYVQYSWLHILLGALSCGLLASAAHAINNIFDLKIDKINKPFRELPSKKLSIKKAWVITLLLYLFSFVLAVFVGFLFFILILLMSFLTVIYSCPPFRCKNHWLYAALIIALFRGVFVILAGWAAVKNLNYILPWYISLLSFLFLIGATPTKDIADMKGDRKNNCLTLPVKYGLRKTIKIIAPFLIIPFLLVPIGVYLKILHINTLPLTLLLFYSIYILFLIKKFPNKLTAIEKNHISWKHVYILFMVLEVGMMVSYLL